MFLNKIGQIQERLRKVKIAWWNVSMLACIDWISSNIYAVKGKGIDQSLIIC